MYSVLCNYIEYNLNISNVKSVPYFVQHSSTVLRLWLERMVKTSYMVFKISKRYDRCTKRIRENLQVLHITVKKPKYTTYTQKRLSYMLYKKKKITARYNHIFINNPKFLSRSFCVFKDIYFICFYLRHL